jgi:hypothetical protein
MLHLEGIITRLTVHRDSTGRYAGVLNDSQLAHMTAGTVLFVVTLDRRVPFSYVGTQLGYTHSKRDAEQDEPLVVSINVDEMNYRRR